MKVALWETVKNKFYSIISSGFFTDFLRKRPDETVVLGELFFAFTLNFLINFCVSSLLTSLKFITEYIVFFNPTRF